jgi:hypothetical protein
MECIIAMHNHPHSHRAAASIASPPLRPAATRTHARGGRQQRSRQRQQPAAARARRHVARHVTAARRTPLSGKAIAAAAAAAAAAHRTWMYTASDTVGMSAYLP